MQRSSEFPLFFQTTIAIFGFLMLIAVASSFAAPSSNASSVSAESTITATKN
ncbi:MAG: hypothetical protein NW224_22880 [Leptolyngbyaceae cyanobacterium bins.302]|nr:hypothetical protein [Leptolyngbyaceae cyanobacterium bins.302]